MPNVDREGTPEHTTHYPSCGCAEAKIEELRQLLNLGVVKLDSCYQDYKKYRKRCETLEAALEACRCNARVALLRNSDPKDLRQKLGVIEQTALAALKGGPG